MHSHPNVWIFINKIQAEESTATLEYIRKNNGTLAKTNSNTVDVERDLKIQTTKINFRMNFLEFVVMTRTHKIISFLEFVVIILWLQSVPGHPIPWVDLDN